MRIINNLFQQLDEQCADPTDQSRSRIPLALCIAAICLLAVHYLKFHHVFASIIDSLGGLNLKQQLEPYYELYGHIWWSFIHLIWFLIIPLVCIKFVLRDEFKHYHLGWGTTHQHYLGYAALLTPILCFVVLVTVFRDDFAQHYPFYSQASRSALDFIAWELAYIIQFIALEFFFRGFLLGACERQLGSHAVFIMVLPYVMIHFPKLWLEATGALFFGIFLGILALRSRSIWGGVFVHIGIAVSMDIAAIIKRSL